MNIYILRDIFSNQATLAQVHLDLDGFGLKPFGYCVEDTDRGLDQDMELSEIKKLKIQGRTAIPVGRYRVVLETSGKYGKDCPTVQNVIGYRYIRFHPGNSHEDTEGCILVAKIRDPQTMKTYNSKKWSDWLVAEIQKRIHAGEEVWLEIQRDASAWEKFQDQSVS